MFEQTNFYPLAQLSRDDTVISSMRKVEEGNWSWLGVYGLRYRLHQAARQVGPAIVRALAGRGTG